MLSVTELRGSNLSVSVYDLKYVENKNAPISSTTNILEESVGNASKKDDKEGNKTNKIIIRFRGFLWFQIEEILLQQQ